VPEAPAGVATRTTDSSGAWPRLGLLAGIAAPIVSWTLSVVVIASWPGNDPIRQSISLLATAPLGWIQNLAFVLAGLLNLAWAFALPGVLGSTPRERTFVRASQLLQGLIVLAFALVPTDPESAPVSTIGQLHLANYALYALTMPLTLLLVGVVMRRDRRWPRTAARLTVVAAALAITGIALTPVTLDGPLRPWLGLLERLFVAIPSLWQIAAGLVSLRLATEPPVPRASTSDASRHPRAPGG
jgi:hypothetical membrane protein